MSCFEDLFTPSYLCTGIAMHRAFVTATEPADFTPLFSLCVSTCIYFHEIYESRFVFTVNNFTRCKSEWNAMRQIMRVCEFMLQFSAWFVCIKYFTRQRKQKTSHQWAKSLVEYVTSIRARNKHTGLNFILLVDVRSQRYTFWLLNLKLFKRRIYAKNQ